MPSLWVLLNQISNQLKPVSDNPRFEAELLLAHALNTKRAELLSKIKEEITIPEQLNQWLERRKKHEPIAYILGYTEFFGIKIKTVPPVFIPRPETELLVEETLKIIKKKNKEKFNILELCTGTGCISIAVYNNACKKVKCIATDINEKAVILAKHNTEENKSSINFIICNLFTSLDDKNKFDIILANPPYIPEKNRDILPSTVKDYEDSRALFCPGDGTYIIQKIISEARRYLTMDGWLLLEIGDDQKETVERIFQENGYDNIKTLFDLQKLPRVVKGNWNKTK
ncbi:MAG: peptide chain release factor N(5)-glutamine methyltransferase [Candidatus Hydrogenedens sp.]